MATYFGEVTALESRAVWYSDEEDSEEEQLMDSDDTSKSETHETVRSKLSLCFERFVALYTNSAKECIITLASSSQYKNFKTIDKSILPIGHYRDLARVFLCSTTSRPGIETKDMLWFMFDQNASLVKEFKVSYLVEALREQLYSEFRLSTSCPVYIISKYQHSGNEQLSYLSNLAKDPADLELPFTGCPTRPPAIVKNRFVSALFEQLTLTLKLAFVVFLPDPKDHWFDKARYWPTIPDQIIDETLYNDCELENTLMFM